MEETHGITSDNRWCLGAPAKASDDRVCDFT